MKASMLLWCYVMLGTVSFAQNNGADLFVDTNKVTLTVSVMNGCVINSVNEMEFQLFPDSTIVHFVFFEGPLNTQIDMGFVTVPYNMKDELKNYYRSIQTSKLNITSEFKYRLEFEGVRLYGDYRLEVQEHQMLSNWFDEFKRRYKK